VQIDEETLALRIAQGSDPSKAETFRFGGQGNWKHEFSPHHVIEMKAAGSNLLSALGYELNEDWNLNTISKKRIPSGTIMNPISSIRSLLSNVPVLTIAQYLEIRKESKGKKSLEKIIDEWALDFFIEHEQYQHAIPILEELLKQELSNPLWNYLYALSLHRLGKHMTKALHHYNYALENGYEEFSIKYNRGLLFTSIGDKDAAIADLERAKRLKPEHKSTREISVATSKIAT
jgi:tetratricopeptide (TPR) repeat protein